MAKRHFVLCRDEGVRISWYTRASFPACGSSALSEALPVTQHGLRGRHTFVFRALSE